MIKILLPAAIIVLLVAAFFIRPSDEGQPYAPYFESLNKELRSGYHAHPVLVLDLDLLDRNIETLMNHVGSPGRYRIVAKSLPSLKLIDYISKKTGTNKVMVFHQPFINLMAEKFPRLEMLLGKPMPIGAVRTFYANLKVGAPLDPARQIQWLVDSEARLMQYLAFAREKRIKLSINIEIDVGLHRGGLRDTSELDRMLLIIRENQNNLTFTGFMGYEAHISKAPPLLSSQNKALKKAIKTYGFFVEHGRKNFPDLFNKELTFNSAGSTTYQLYKDIDLINDISVGSGLVKPTDFDVPTLADHVPALFIATPVLKKSPGLRIPYLEFLSPFWGLVNPNWKMTHFIYGGYWKALYHQPPGMRKNSIYGSSSNQEIATSSPGTALSVDDFVFLRPTQSEAVMLQFGDILVLRNGKVVESWPVFTSE